MELAQIREAIRQGDLSQLKVLLSNGSQICFLVDENNLLHVAAGFGHQDIVKLLLNIGASVNVIATQTGRLPIHEACSHGNVEVLQLLLKKTNNLDVQDKDGMTAAHISASNGEVKCLSLLSDAGANLVLGDKQGLQPSHWAAKRDQHEVLSMLFNIGVDLAGSYCKKGRQPLHYAALFGGERSLRCLAERCSDLTVEDYAGNQPLHVAAWKNHLDCVRLLVQQGVSADTRSGQDARTAVHFAALYGAVDCLHWLLEKGVSANMQDDHGNTVGHYACKGGHAKCFNCFLAHQGSLELRNNRGETALDAARRFGHPVLMDKATKNEIGCPLCNQITRRYAWEMEHKPPPVITAMQISASTVYNSPLGAFEPEMRKNALAYQSVKQQRQQQQRINSRMTTSGKSSARREPEATSSRDLVTRYYGRHVDKI